jgi:hypothetical protein
MHVLQRDIKEVRLYPTVIARDIARSHLYKRGYRGFTDFNYPVTGEYALAYSKKMHKKRSVKAKV